MTTHACDSLVSISLVAHQLICAMRYTCKISLKHYNDVIMGAITFQISLTIVYSTVYSDADQREHQSSMSLAYVRGIHRGPLTFPTQMASYAENVSIWWRHHVSLRWPLRCFSYNVYSICWTTVCSRYIAVIFLWRFHERHSIAGPWGRESNTVWGVVRECKFWPKFYHCNCCSVWTTVL